LAQAILAQGIRWRSKPKFLQSTHLADASPRQMLHLWSPRRAGHALPVTGGDELLPLEAGCSAADDEKLDPAVVTAAEDGAAPFVSKGLRLSVLVLSAVSVAAVCAVAARSSGYIAHEHAHGNTARPFYSASGDRLSYLHLFEAPPGTCKLPEGWCSNKVRGDTLYYRDCDGDGVKEPYCEGGELLRFGYLSKNNDCEDNWPNGLCRMPQEIKSREVQKLQPAASNEITVIHFNDVYQVGGVLENGIRRGGMSRAAYVIEQERARNPNRTFVVFAGDLLSPSILSDLFQGEQMVDILNELSLDAASIGNHEFDFGVDMLLKRIQESKFKWLNSNLVDTKTGKLLNGTQERLIREVPWLPRFSEDKEERKLKLCMFGASYDVRKSMFKDVDRIEHIDAIEAARREAAHLRNEEDCKVVFALTHQAGASDCQMSEELGDDVDLILGGHDHATELNTNCGPAPYVKADMDLKTQWVMSLFLGDDGRVTSVDGRVLQLTDVDPFDRSIHDKVVEWEDRGNHEMGKRLGCSSVAVNTKEVDVRQHETNGGNFFADAIRKFHKTDIVLVNSGSIRGDKVLSAGNLSKKDVTEWHPFGNTIVKIYVTGKQIRDYVESSLECYSDACGAFLAVSGVNYTFNPRAKVGSRLKTLVLPSGREVQEGQTFTLGLTNYMHATSPLKDSKLFDMVSLNDAVPVVTALYEAVEVAGDSCIHPQIDGRIVVL